MAVWLVLYYRLIVTIAIFLIISFSVPDPQSGSKARKRKVAISEQQVCP